MELYHANTQWAKRPADEKFRTLADLHEATKSYAVRSKTKEVPWNQLRVEAQGNEMALVGSRGVPVLFSHYALGQFASRVGAPAAYLRKLPATLAAQNLNHGLKERADGVAQLLYQPVNGADSNWVLRAATSEKYSRIWNYEVAERLIDFSERYGMEPARQTFNWSGEKMTQEQIDAAQRSLYASDHDMFAFLMSKDRVITGPDGSELRRGVITINSEVGDRRLSFIRFLFREVCGNHIIWDASEVASIDLVHVGSIRDRLFDAMVRVRKYLDGAASLEQAQFSQLLTRIATTKDEVLDTLFGKRIATKVTLEASFAAVKQEQDGDPLSHWGFAQGMTRYSQTLPYGDERTEIDRAAGKVLALAR